jgi:hypothetical protein
MNPTNTIMAPIKGAEHQEVAGVQLDIVQAGAARIKRVIYPVGFRWSRDMKGIVHTNLCMHAHAGFLAQGRLTFQYPDGITEEFIAPQVVAVEPGHDGWVSGEEPAVLIEFDFLEDTVQILAIPEVHHHNGDQGQSKS